MRTRNVPNSRSYIQICLTVPTILELLTLLMWIRRSSGRLSTRHKLSSTCRGHATEQQNDHAIIRKL